MSGILPDAGFIYQRKVIIHEILSSLLKSDYKCSFAELTVVVDRNTAASMSVDFSLNCRMGDEVRYYEMKDWRYLNEKLKDPVQVLHKIHKALRSETGQYILVHTSNVFGRLGKLSELRQGHPDRIHILKSLLDYEADVERFETKFTIRKIDDTVVEGGMTLLDLRSDSLIHGLAKDYGDFGMTAVSSVRSCIETCYENIIMKKAQELKGVAESTSAENYPVMDKIMIDLASLLMHDGSLVDMIFNSNNCNFSTRNDVLNDLFNKFGILVPPELGVNTNESN